MKISDILVEKTPHLSFEVFPPKTDAAYEGVLKATEAIAELKPSYMSVTYGAGGGTSKNTVKLHHISKINIMYQALHILLVYHQQKKKCIR